MKKFMNFFTTRKFLALTLSLLCFTLLYKLIDNLSLDNHTITSSWVIALASGYYLGSIPFGLILTQFFTSHDIRAIGSGSIGATNVLRTGKKKLAAITLFLDAMKGVLSIFIVQYLLPGDTLGALLAALGALLGHCFPVWLNFRGGKGVATAAGVLLTLNPKVGLITAVIWILTFFITRYSSLAALVACILTPVSAYFLGDKPFLYFTLALTILIFCRHLKNIERLVSGKELKFGK